MGFRRWWRILLRRKQVMDYENPFSQTGVFQEGGVDQTVNSAAATRRWTAVNDEAARLPTFPDGCANSLRVEPSFYPSRSISFTNGRDRSPH